MARKRTAMHLTQDGPALIYAGAVDGFTVEAKADWVSLIGQRGGPLHGGLVFPRSFTAKVTDPIERVTVTLAVETDDPLPLERMLQNEDSPPRRSPRIVHLSIEAERA